MDIQGILDHMDDKELKLAAEEGDAVFTPKNDILDNK